MKSSSLWMRVYLPGRRKRSKTSGIVAGIALPELAAAWAAASTAAASAAVSAVAPVAPVTPAGAVSAGGSGMPNL